MFDAFWSDFKWKIFLMCFCPYFVYFMTAQMYLVLMLYDPDEEALLWDFDQSSISYIDKTELPLRIGFILLLLMNILVEFMQCKTDGLRLHYANQPQNIIDAISFFLNFLVILSR